MTMRSYSLSTAVARGITVLSVALLVVLGLRPVAAQTCVGDCKGSGTVDISDLLIGVNIALGSQPVTACPAFDCTNDQMVTVSCLVKGVNNALNGCPGAPTITARNIPTPTDTFTSTATNTATATPTPSATATATPTNTRTPTSTRATTPLTHPLPQTGQTQCDPGDQATLGSCPGTPAGQDGELREGAARSDTDNGDGTVTDNVTGLTWEKLSNDGSIHDYTTAYTWADAFTKVATLNSGSFAGHSDWRLPNVNELQSLANYGTANPSVDAAFNTSCAASCTVTSCSCTQSLYYWSSTTDQGGPTSAWMVYFNGGYVIEYFNKGTGNYVRAVRGGA